MRLNIQARIAESLTAQLGATLTPQQEAQIHGLVSRGVKEAYIDNGHLFFVLTDNSTVDLGQVVGAKGDKGDKGDGFPEVTAADNNKIMRVVEGEWALSAFYTVTGNDAGGNTLSI